MLGLSRAPDRRLVGRERLSGFIELQLIENRLQENKASFKDYRMPSADFTPHPSTWKRQSKLRHSQGTRITPLLHVGCEGASCLPVQ